MLIEGGSKQVISDMNNTEQTAGQSVYRHGLTVSHRMEEMRCHLVYGHRLHREWKLPSWLEEHRDFIKNKLYPSRILARYTILHDCGKPYCREVDEQGRVHFPDHANVSADVFQANWTGAEPTVVDLIRRDMEIHTIKAKDVPEFIRDSRMAVTLLIAGLCEVHANAEMFGGVDSTSFKIKWKQIEKRGKAILKELTA